MQQDEVAAAVVFLRTSGVNRVSNATYDANAGKAQNTRRNLRLFSTLGFSDSRELLTGCKLSAIVSLPKEGVTAVY